MKPLYIKIGITIVTSALCVACESKVVRNPQPLEWSESKKLAVGLGLGGKTGRRLALIDAKTFLSGSSREWQVTDISVLYGGAREVLKIEDAYKKVSVYLIGESGCRRINNGESLDAISTVMQGYRPNLKGMKQWQLRVYFTLIMDLHSGHEQLALFPNTVSGDSVLAYSEGDRILGVRLSRYCRQGQISIRERDFSAQFYALTKDGSVNRWEVHGNSHSGFARITSIKVSQVAPSGTFFYAVIR